MISRRRLTSASRKTSTASAKMPTSTAMHWRRKSSRDSTRGLNAESSDGAAVGLTYTRLELPAAEPRSATNPAEHDGKPGRIGPPAERSLAAGSAGQRFRSVGRDGLAEGAQIRRRCRRGNLATRVDNIGLAGFGITAADGGGDGLGRSAHHACDRIDVAGHRDTRAQNAAGPGEGHQM